MLTLPPLSLYIHYPWCVKKCPYCDFNSHEKHSNTDRYVKHLIDDIKQELLDVSNRQIHSIFIGGGTPSLLSGDEVKYLLNTLNQSLDFSSNIEITLEANPATAEMKKFKAFKQAGVNRLSIGVQNFDNHLLKKIGRIHNQYDGKTAIKIAQDSGFKQINIDLMYGLPQQSQQSIIDNIEVAISLAPQHISHYQLTIEPNTYFAKYPPKLPKHDEIFESEQTAKQYLTEAGYPQYEISAYGKTPSKHNLNYWQFGDYLGIGAGAHGKITLENGQIIRTTKAKSPKDYQSNPQRKTTTIATNQIAFEFMLGAFRLKQGFNIELFESRTGLKFESIQNKVQLAIKDDLLQYNQHQYCPTTKGFNFLNDLQALFL